MLQHPYSIYYNLVFSVRLMNNFIHMIKNPWLT